MTSSSRPSTREIVLIDDQFIDWSVSQLRKRHIDVRSGSSLADAEELFLNPFVVAFIDARIPTGRRGGRPDSRWGLRALEIAGEACPSACRVLATAYSDVTMKREAHARGAAFESKPVTVPTMLQYLFWGIGKHHGLADAENRVLADLAIERRMPPTVVQLAALAALDFRAADAREHLSMTQGTFKGHSKTLLDCVGVGDFRAVGEFIRARARALRHRQTRTLPRG